MLLDESDDETTSEITTITEVESTTTATTTPTSTTPPTPVFNYKCDFDMDICDSVLSVNSGNIFESTDMGFADTYSITDVSSISNILILLIKFFLIFFLKIAHYLAQSTSNGEPCQIPWYEGTNIYYHCDSAFECITNQAVDNTTSNCYRGFFLTITKYLLKKSK